MNSDLTNRSSKVMTTEQFTQVVDAILEGKYSWACLLILRFAGYNPLHYIPYRTYNRLMKDHCQSGCKKPANNTENHDFVPLNYPRYSAKINDLSYLEALSAESPQIHGGNTSKDCNTQYASSRIHRFLQGFKISTLF